MTPIAAVIAIGCAGQVPSESPREAPAWVPFQADFRSVGGNAETRGRFFRRGDGSVRRETLAADGSHAFVTIENRALARFYSFSDGSWTVQPLVLARPAPPGASDFPNATPERTSRDGLDLVGVITPTGAVILRAPALNYFGLVEEHPDPPLKIEFHAIRREEPPSVLFEPPPGASVARLPWPHP